jgi:glycosyltransferase involved in cell wall biosynthesis
MKRILIFSLNYHPFIGGAEVALKEITDRMSPQEYEFHLLTLRYDALLPRHEKIGNITIHRFGFARPHATISDQSTFPLKLNKYWYQVIAPWYAHRLHKRYTFDLVWGMMAHAVAVPAGIFKRQHPEVKYVLTLQEGDPPEYIENLMKPVWPLFVQGFTSADAVQAISTFLLAWGKRMGSKGAMRVIPNGVATVEFTKDISSEVREGMRKRLAIHDGEVSLITTSRLVYKNAVDDVIRSLVYLPDNVTFVVCGIGPDENMLRQLARELSLEHRVRFVGQIAHSELPIALRVSNIFIRPSRSEGMGNSFLEAMAAGLPVIATQEGGISDFLFDERLNKDKMPTGWAVSKNTPEDIARAVKDIIARPQKVIEVTKTAKNMVFAKYDWNIVANDMEKLFVEVLSKNPSTSALQ